MIPASFPGLPTEMVLQILSNLDDQSLFLCRLVNRRWCQVSSTILQDRPSVLVRAWCPPVSWMTHSFSNLIKCFNQSLKFCHPFPYTSFEMRGYRWTKEECPDLELFFALSIKSRSDPGSGSGSGSGILIKCISFEYISPRLSTLSTLERLIFLGTPHLRILRLEFDYAAVTREDCEITSAGTFDNETQSFSHHALTDADRTLPSLKVLQLGRISRAVPSTLEFVTRILRAAPNLQRIKVPSYLSFTEHHLQLFIDTNKIHLVNECSFQLSSDLADSGLLTREKLSGFQPKVLRLSPSGYVHDLWQKMLCLWDLLWTVKDTVEELETDSSFGLLDNLGSIRFPKLRTWSINYGVNPIFPPGMRSRDPFPSLEKICISFGYKAGAISPAWSISSIPVIPSLHSLKIDADAPFAKQGDAKECIESMGLMGPNLRDFELFYHLTRRTNFTSVGPLIWTNMSKLQTLTLRKPWAEKHFWNEMEAGFTGFSIDTVRQLCATKWRKWPKVEDVGHLRVNPSILQMPELKNLIVCKNMLDKGSASTQFLSLSYKYAFNLMPQLVVEIRTF